MPFVRSLPFAVPVKLLALFCVMLGVFLAADTDFTWVLSLAAIIYLGFQGDWRQLFGYGLFYGILSLLLMLIRRFGMTMLVFSEFSVFLFWWLTPVFIVSWNLMTSPPGTISAFLSRIHAPISIILGMLVVFRFFPTMRAELKGLRDSMHNRGITSAGHLLRHPVSSFEYSLVPLLLRCLQIADQLSVSAVARGIEAPGERTSYSEQKTGLRDVICMLIWLIVTAAFLVVGGIG